MHFFITAAVSGFLGVALGAFAAHSLKASLTQEMVDIFETGVRYQMYHTVALFIAGWAVQKYHLAIFSTAGWMFLAGIAIFSGSLYVLALTGTRWLGAITPVGGLAFLAGWLTLAYGFWKASGQSG